LSNRITDYSYLFLASALGAKQPKTLTMERMERMLGAPSFDEAAKLLADCGYTDMSGMRVGDVEKTLAVHRVEIFAEVRSLIPEPELLDAFCLKYDYHNAKVLMKAESAEADGKYLLSDSGTLSVETLSDAYYSEDYSALPDHLARALGEAKSILKRTENPQLADFVLDKAYFADMKAVAARLYSPFLSDYIKVSVDGANLRATVRTRRMGRDEAFLREALTEGGNVDIQALSEAAYSEEGFAWLFDTTLYRQAAQLGAEAVKGGRLTAFEKECDNVLIRFFGENGYTAFGSQPVIAYLAALENEIMAARMILTGKLTGVDPGLIRERLRDIYA